MANNIKLRIIVEDEATGKLKVVERDLKGFEKSVDGAAESTGGFGDIFSGLMGKLTIAVGVATAAGAALKKAFDLGAEGAAIQQTEESFGLLLEKVGASPRLLDELTEASGRTITQLELMQATSTLLAGAQGELATQLANATPELLEIARAAAKLNPGLGDTTFLYESLATGIKRASPLILDNLGLTIKIGEANEKYAEQLGKTVEQLTAEEQKIALLNATLEAGGVLIDQVGDNVESATDPFKRLETTIDEIGQIIKSGFVPAATAAADALDRIFGHGIRADRSFEEMKASLDLATLGYEEYIDALIGAALASGKLDREVLNLGTGITITDRETIALSETIGGLTREQFSAYQASVRAAEGYREQSDEAKRAAENIETLEDSLRAANDELAEMRDTHREVTPEQQKFIDNVKIIGEVGTEYARALGAMGEATKDLGFTNDSFAEDLDSLIANLEDRATPQTVSYQLAVDSLVAAYKRGEITGSELLELLIQLREEMNKGNSAAETAAGVIANYGKAWEDVKNGVKNTLSELQNLLLFLQQHPELFGALTQRDVVGVINDDENLGPGGDSPGGPNDSGANPSIPPNSGTKPPGESAPPIIGPGGAPDAAAPPVTVNITATVTNDVDIEQLAYRVAEVIQRKNPQ